MDPRVKAAWEEEEREREMIRRENLVAEAQRMADLSGNLSLINKLLPPDCQAIIGKRAEANHADIYIILPECDPIGVLLRKAGYLMFSSSFGGVNLSDLSDAIRQANTSWMNRNRDFLVEVMESPK